MGVGGGNDGIYLELGARRVLNHNKEKKPGFEIGFC